MINKAKLALVVAVAAVSVASPALAQSQIVSPPNTASPPSLFVPQTGQTFQNLPTLSGSGPGGAETSQDRAARCAQEAGVSGPATTGSVIGSCVNQ
jgi:hypothetical protein